VAGRALGLDLDRADGVILAAGALAVGVFRLAEQRIAGAVGLPLDDGWIHLRLARNLAAGQGFAINPGEPVAASTGPLWTIALAVLLQLGLPAVAAAKALGLACHAATGLVARRLAREAGLRPSLALAAGLGTVGLARLVWGALSGMEVPLAALLIGISAWAVAAGRPDTAALSLGLATLARPEAGLLALLHVLGARDARGALRRFGLTMLVVAPQVGFSLGTVGRLVPAPAAAKATGGLIGGLEGLGADWAESGRLAAAYLGEWIGVLASDHVVLPWLLPVGLVALRRHPLRWLAAGLVLHPLAVAIVAPYRGPGFQTGRYSSHLLPLVVLVACVGLAHVLPRVPGRAARAAVLAGLLLALAWRLPAAAEGYAWGVQNINAMQVWLGRWIADQTPRDTVLAVNDIGAITYFGDRRIIDLVGLATPEILPYRRQGDAGLLRYLAERCPEYLVIFPTWYPELAGRGDLFRPMTAVTLPHNVVAGGTTMVVYQTVWHRDWKPAPAACPGRLAG
jgi:arabinofuranosyltransferase